MERRTDELIEIHRLKAVEHILEVNPSKSEFYKYYKELTGCGFRTAYDDYKKILSMVADELREDVNVLRTKRIQNLERMQNQLFSPEFLSEVDPDKRLKLQLDIEKLIAELEGLKNFKQEVHSTTTLEVPDIDKIWKFKSNKKDEQERD